MKTDRELLESYARDRSESAFAELVRRHIDVVYSAALRESHGDASLAQDITQAIFVELAGKAARLSRHPALAGWLYTCVRHVAANARRSEIRRQRRELEAHQMKELLSADSVEIAWRQLQPVLDDAMHDLNETDRAAVVLRYFENRSYKEVGLALGLAENAARMRAERSLEKLKTVLAKRGITSTASGLAAALVFGGMASAPTGLAATIATGAFASAAGSGTTVTLLKVMSMTKIKTGLAAAMVVGSVATSLIIQQNADAKMRVMDVTLGQQSEQIAGLEKAGERTIAAPTSSTDQMDELQKLRAEVAALRNQTNAIATLRGENQRLRAARAPSQPAAGLQDQVAAQEESMTRMSHGKQLALGVIQAAMENHDQVSTNFDDAMKHIGGPTAVETLVPDQFEIAYQGSLLQREIDPSRLILIREKQPRKMPDGTWQRVYIHLDGSGVNHSERDGHFEDYEAQNGIKPTPR